MRFAPPRFVHRVVLVAALLGHTALYAQYSPKPEANPLERDSFWQFQVGSETYARARRTLESNPSPSDAIAAHLKLGSKPGAVRAARGLLTASPIELAKGLRIIRDGGFDFGDDGTTISTEFKAFVADIRPVVARLSPAEGADAALSLLTLEYLADRGNVDANKASVAAFREKYAGTPAALEYLVGHIESDNPRDTAGNVLRFRELARQHDGTVAGAMALYLHGFRQGNQLSAAPDPTERLLEVFSVVKELKSGRFPQCRWVDDAPALVSGFYFGLQTNIPSASVSRLYDGYLRFVLDHPKVQGRFTGGDSIVWIVLNGVLRLGTDVDSRIATAERFFYDLEDRGFGINAARLLRARFYLALSQPPEMQSDERRGLIASKDAEARAGDSLRLMKESANATAVAQAMAIEAATHLEKGRFAAAHVAYRALQQQFPDEPWSWVAALRAAQAREAAGEAGAAAADYERIATEFRSQNAVVLLASMAAAETREGSGGLPAAADSYRSAIAAWQDLPERLALQTSVDPAFVTTPALRRYFSVTKTDLVTRVARLEKSLSPEGRLLYEGRRAFEAEKFGDAIGPLRRLVSNYPRSVAANEGRMLLRRARLANALVTIEQQVAESERELDALTRGSHDSVVALAKLASGAIRLRAGAPAAAESVTRKALDEWHAKQSPTLEGKTSIEHDIAAIRRELFLPKGGGIFGTRGWNAFQWSDQASSPFLLVNRDVMVKGADGKETTYVAPFVTPAGMRVIFVSREDIAALQRIVTSVGGAQTREWVNATDVPNQPYGMSVQIARMWAKLFPVRPGHWGGWAVVADPSLSRITFDRDGHALAEIRIGYSGCTIELEREKGKWIAKRQVSVWIE